MINNHNKDNNSMTAAYLAHQIFVDVRDHDLEAISNRVSAICDTYTDLGGLYYGAALYVSSDDSESDRAILVPIITKKDGSGVRHSVSFHERLATQIYGSSSFAKPLDARRKLHTAEISPLIKSAINLFGKSAKLNPLSLMTAVPTLLSLKSKLTVETRYKLYSVLQLVDDEVKTIQLPKRVVPDSIIFSGPAIEMQSIATGVLSDPVVAEAIANVGSNRQDNALI